MTFSDVVSQAVYVCAAVLIVSAVAKLLDLRHFGSPSSSNTDEGWINSLMDNKFVFFLIAGVELVVGTLALIFANSDSGFRAVAIIAMVDLFFLFTVACIALVISKSTVPCRCFGSLSRSQPRRFQCIRNVFLALAAFAAIWSDPQPLSTLGVGLTIAVLGIIFADEIR